MAKGSIPQVIEELAESVIQAQGLDLNHAYMTTFRSGSSGVFRANWARP